MKLNFNHLLAFIWACLLSFILMLYMTSCSASYHYKKAIKKGLQVVTLSDTITLTKVDSIFINNEWVKVVTEFDTIIQFNTVYVPKTRFQTRIEYKTKKDSLQTIRYVTRQETKQVAKQSGSRLFYNVLTIILICFLLFLLIKWMNKNVR
jgi:ATP-dependent Zn protease